MTPIDQSPAYISLTYKTWEVCLEVGDIQLDQYVCWLCFLSYTEVINRNSAVFVPHDTTEWNSNNLIVLSVDISYSWVSLCLWMLHMAHVILHMSDPNSRLMSVKYN